MANTIAELGLYGSLNGLPPTYVYEGSMDSLAPDVLVLQHNAAIKAPRSASYLAKGEIHDRVLLILDGPQ